MQQQASSLAAHIVLGKLASQHPNLNPREHKTQGIWKCKNQNMAELSKIVKELKDQFMSFQINHMDRESNTEADAQANLAVYLKNGEIQVECDMIT